MHVGLLASRLAAFIRLTVNRMTEITHITHIYRISKWRTRTDSFNHEFKNRYHESNRIYLWQGVNWFNLKWLGYCGHRLLPYILYPSEIQINVTACERVYFVLYVLVNIFLLCYPFYLIQAAWIKWSNLHILSRYMIHMFITIWCHLYIRRMVKIEISPFQRVSFTHIQWHVFTVKMECIFKQWRLKPATNGINHVNWDHWVLRNILIGQRTINNKKSQQ